MIQGGDVIRCCCTLLGWRWPQEGK